MSDLDETVDALRAALADTPAAITFADLPAGSAVDSDSAAVPAGLRAPLAATDGPRCGSIVVFPLADLDDNQYRFLETFLTDRSGQGIPVAVEYSDMVDLWGTDSLIHFPADRFVSKVKFDPSLFPPAGAMPDDVPILFTAHLSGSVALFDMIEIQVGDEEPLRLVVIGSSPDSPDLLFALDTSTGVIALLNIAGPPMELVNSSYALFVEFLYRLGRLISTDPGGEARKAQARALHDELRTADPAAFEDPESWWSTAFAQLAATR